MGSIPSGEAETVEWYMSKPELPIQQEHFNEMVARVFDETETQILNRSFMFGDTKQKRWYLFHLSESIVSRVLDELVRGYADFDPDLCEHSRRREILHDIMRRQ